MDRPNRETLKSCPTGFDHTSAAHVDAWVGEFQEMRDSCPIAWSDKHNGFWVATRYKDVLAMAQDGQTFSSAKTFDAATGRVEGGVNIPPMPIVPSIPAELDMPEWQGYRSLLNRKLSPKQAESRRASVQRIATAMMNRVIEKGEMDLINDFTGPVPAMTTMELIGFPLDEWKEFAEPWHRMMYGVPTDPDYPETLASFARVLARIDEQIVRRRADPEDDLISYLIAEKVDGQQMDNQTISRILFTVAAGGVDTTTNLTAHSLKYLSENPAELQRLRDEPGLISRAREEFNRYFSPAHAMARNVSRDTAIADVELRRGERVLLAFASANRDPEIFDRPDEIVMDRHPNPHVGFGAGMHRCVGAFLANVMVEVIVGEVVRRIPDFQVLADQARRYPAITVVNGWINMPITFTPGPKEPVDLVL